MLAERRAEVIGIGKHMKIRVPDASDQLVVPSTPSDSRAEKNAISALKHLLSVVKTEATVGERREKKVTHEQHREFLQGVTFSNEKKVTFQEQLLAILPTLMLADSDPTVIQLAPAMEKLKETLAEMIFSGMSLKRIAEQAGGVEPAVVSLAIRRLFGKGLREIRKEIDAKPTSRQAFDERELELRIRAGFDAPEIAEHFKVSKATIRVWCERRWSKTFTEIRHDFAQENFEILAKHYAEPDTLTVRMPLVPPAIPPAAVSTPVVVKAQPLLPAVKPTMSASGISHPVPQGFALEEDGLHITRQCATCEGTVRHKVDWAIRQRIAKGIAVEDTCGACRGLLNPDIRHTNGNGNGRYTVGTNDKRLECIQCHETFLFPHGAQEFYRSKGWKDPKRCNECRRENGNGAVAVSAEQ
ncbi:MAG TPA: zinc-ribbon domain containing protein [Candidatus Sulfotelmatobacter sp.]|nr:zinc-ribbon domain containing protein [Candidatus Sulfotelmatobacter sp.]